MKLLKFKEDIYKCSGCGLCQSVCPVYKISKMEPAVSRGKFKLLNAIINKDAEYSYKTLKIMDLCLHCQACSEFCPSGIDAQRIIETAKCDMLSKGIINSPKFLIAQIFSNKYYLKIIKLIIDFIRRYNVLEKIDFFNCPKNKLMRSFLEIKINPVNDKISTDKKVKALYFKGCVNNYINPSSQNAVKKVFANTPVEIIEADFNCCGLPLKSVGDFEQFKKIAKENINTALNYDFDYLIFDCASCKSTFLEYADFLNGSEKEKALKLSEKIISIYELLDIINFSSNINNSKVTIHYPCHTRKTKEQEIIKKIVSSVPNINYVEMEDATSCCGAAGSFFITNSKISKQISDNKAKNIINTNADIVLTTCPSCFLGLKQGLIKNNSNIEVMQLIEFLAKL